MNRVLIVSPAYNEAEILPEFIDAFLKLRSNLSPKVDLRVLIVNDGSTDFTTKKLKELSARNPECLSYISFVANFGYQAALVAGLMHIGDWPEAVITMDADLEQPIELVPQLIDSWRDENNIIVNTLRETHQSLSLRKRFFSKLFYKLTSRLTGLDLFPGQADFRLWDANLLRSVQSYLHNCGSLRVFAAWLPGKKISIPYTQNIREGRTSRFTFKKSWELAVISIVRFSNLPLKVISIMGMTGLLFATIYGIFIAFQVLKGNIVPGWTSLILTVIVMSCLQLISLGVLALYLQRLVFAKDLPPYLIKEKQGSLF